MTLPHESVVLVSGYDSSTGQFGTGFIIHRANDTVYVLTAAHVVREVGKPLYINGIPAEVVADSAPEEFDIAVLKVEGLFDKPPLTLSNVGKEGNPVTIWGFYRPSSSITPELRAIHGSLVGQGMPASKCGRHRSVSWHLRIEGEHVLRSGYSGSPVFDDSSHRVLGVVRSEQKQGQLGIAISVSTIKHIWQNAPFSFEEETFQPAQVPMNPTKATQVFLFYADRDEKSKKQFEEMCLSPLEGRGIIKVWSKDKIKPGENRKQVIERNLNNASIVLLLISRDFMHSYYRNIDDLQSYISQVRQKSEKFKLIPILLKPARWEQEFDDLQVLPKNRKFVNDRAWGGQDAALYEIAKELKEEMS